MTQHTLTPVDNGILDDSPVKDMAIAPPRTKAELKAAIAAEEQQQVAACEAELKELLARHHCGLNTIQVWQGGAPGPIQIQVIALTEGK